jgi:hypothetical protein
MLLLANFRKKCERKISLGRPRNRWGRNVNMGVKHGVDFSGGSVESVAVTAKVQTL